ncbi:hypothetical protein BSKO_01723 [Bryopsis sp. KO-2023]|nr:hypothetical protein BSKO_01723 [Bryopsis sp. KO-2023]
MFATYTVRLQSSISSMFFGMKSLFTGTIAVFDGSTRIEHVPIIDPDFSNAFVAPSVSKNSMNANRFAEFGSPHTRQSMIWPPSEKNVASSSSVTIWSMSDM